MMATFVMALMLAQPAQRTDTTFAVQPGGRLEIEALNGAATVRTWDRAAIRVQARHDAGTRIEVRQRGGRVRLESEHRAPQPPGRRAATPRPPAQPDRVEYEITLPRNFNVEIEGVSMPVSVSELNGTVEVSNVAGAVTIRGVSGHLKLESVGGPITVENTQGVADISTVNETIRLVDVRGAVDASAVNGSIIMRGIDARRVQASTVNGTVDYEGAFHDDGRYYFGAHNGRITLAVPEGINATLAVTTRRGQVESAFRVPVSTARDGRVSITYGTGSATIEVESYNGSVRLVRPPGR